MMGEEKSDGSGLGVFFPLYHYKYLLILNYTGAV